MTIWATGGRWPATHPLAASDHPTWQSFAVGSIGVLEQLGGQ
jgi:hypothetical protein